MNWNFYCFDSSFTKWAGLQLVLALRLRINLEILMLQHVHQILMFLHQKQLSPVVGVFIKDELVDGHLLIIL